MDKDEQVKKLFQKHWEKTEEERRKELIELGVNPLAKYMTKELEDELKRRKDGADSKYVVNKGCCMCGKIEIGLAEMTVGKSKHTLCYKCMYEFIEDLKAYQDMNYTEADVKKMYE